MPITADDRERVEAFRAYIEDSVAADDRYVTVNLTPKRVDLIDESHGWGARETLDLT